MSGSNTKFKIGDWVKIRNRPVLPWEVGVIHTRNGHVSYWHPESSSFVYEEDLELYKDNPVITVNIPVGASFPKFQIGQRVNCGIRFNCPVCTIESFIFDNELQEWRYSFKEKDFTCLEHFIWPVNEVKGENPSIGYTTAAASLSEADIKNIQKEFSAGFRIPHSYLFPEVPVIRDSRSWRRKRVLSGLTTN